MPKILRVPNEATIRNLWLSLTVLISHPGGGCASKTSTLDHPWHMWQRVDEPCFTYLIFTFYSLLLNISFWCVNNFIIFLNCIATITMIWIWWLLIPSIHKHYIEGKSEQRFRCKNNVVLHKSVTLPCKIYVTPTYVLLHRLSKHFT